MTAYYVRENDYGYMPDDDPAEFSTLAEAKDYARSLLKEWYDLKYDPDGFYRGLAITIWQPLKTIHKSDCFGGVIYASIDTTIDRVIVISAE